MKKYLQPDKKITFCRVDKKGSGGTCFVVLPSKRANLITLNYTYFNSLQGIATKSTGSCLYNFFEYSQIL